MREKRTVSNLKTKAKEQLLGNYSIAAGSFALLFVFVYAAMMIVSQATFIFAFGKAGLENMTAEQAQALMSNKNNEIMFMILTYILMAIMTPLISLITTGYTYICREISYQRRPKTSDLFYCFKNHPDKVIIISLILYGIQLVFTLPLRVYMNGFDDFTNMSGQAFLIYVVVMLVEVLIMAVVSLMTSQSYIIYIDEPSFGALECLKKSIAIMKGNKWRLFYMMLTFIGYGLLSVFSLGIALLWIVPYQEVSLINFYRDLKGDLDECSNTAEMEMF